MDIQGWGGTQAQTAPMSMQDQAEPEPSGKVTLATFTCTQCCPQSCRGLCLEKLCAGATVSLPGDINKPVNRPALVEKTLK